jgi:para-aminobenzoate synthetase component I
LDMDKVDRIRINIRPVILPDGPRGIMGRLRKVGRFALLESALAVPGLGSWSYLAGPQRATLYTGETDTRLTPPGQPLMHWNDPFEALEQVSRVALPDPVIEGDCPPGMGFIGGWVGMLGYDLARQVERIPSRARQDPRGMPRSVVRGTAGPGMHRGRRRRGQGRWPLRAGRKRR